jgi:hypothetical protein
VPYGRAAMYIDIRAIDFLGILTRFHPSLTHADHCLMPDSVGERDDQHRLTGRITGPKMADVGEVLQSPAPAPGSGMKIPAEAFALAA